MFQGITKFTIRLASLSCLLAVQCGSAFAETGSLLPLEAQYSDVIPAVLKARNWDKRIRIYQNFNLRLDKDLKALQPPLAADKLELAANFLELGGLVNRFPPSSLKKSRCASAPVRILRWSNSQAVGENDPTPAEKWFLELFRAICAP